MPLRRRIGAAMLALSGASLVACGQSEVTHRPSFTEAESHAHYTAALHEFGLDRTALGREWLRAADQALADPVVVTLPFSESGYLPPASPAALGYRFPLQRGRTFRIDVSYDGDPSARLFIQLFELSGEHEPPRVVAEAVDGARGLIWEARRDGDYVLRLQPELLRGGRITVVERTVATLGFPVQGLSLAAVQSVFGDPRDGGVRDHHGVDIFAPRGTPVVAAVSGRVRVDTGNRGGQLIWLYDEATGADLGTGRRRGRRLYYAHLDGWAVANGDVVRAGDVIGFVGNTGNARTTPPHLHFGVYDRGPLDPLPFLRPDDPEPRGPSGALDLLDAWVRVSRSGAPLRASASNGAAVQALLGRDQVLRVRAAAGQYYRVQSPQGRWGYVGVGDVTPAVDALTVSMPAHETPVREIPHPRGAVVDVVPPSHAVDILGYAGSYSLVRLPDARLAWLASTATALPPGL